MCIIINVYDDDWNVLYKYGCSVNIISFDKNNEKISNGLCVRAHVRFVCVAHCYTNKMNEVK